VFGADLFLTPFMEIQVRTVTDLSGIKKIWKIYLSDFPNRVFLPLTRGGLISVVPVLYLSWIAFFKSAN